ncbi:MAG: nuclear transport factor 2 family protein [Myxococcota bacterium]
MTGSEATTDRNKTAVHAFFAALGRGDRKALGELCTPDLAWVVPAGAALHAGTHRGAERVFDTMLSAVGNTFVPGSQRVSLGLLVAESNAVMAEARVTAKGVDGRAYENVYVFVFEFEGEKIRELREHVDTRYAAEFFA